MGIAITPQLEIIFDTVKSSRKYPNLIARPACSFVIGGWGTGEQTVQYEGEAAELKSPQLARYQETYFKVWTDGPARMSWPGIVYFVVRPRWIRYSDFDQNPPLLAEFTFPSKRLLGPYRKHRHTKQFGAPTDLRGGAFDTAR
jgi:hypothetical protein